jgi:hypothetical protein
VPVNELPGAALRPKQAGHSDRYREEFVAASDLGSPAFNLDDTGEIVGDILCYKFCTGDLSVTVMRGGAR